MLKQQEIQARQQQVLPVGGILCMADFACLVQRWVPCEGTGTASSPSLHQYFGQNTLLSWTSKREVGEKHLPRNFLEQGCS